MMLLMGWEYVICSKISPKCDGGPAKDSLPVYGINNYFR